MCYDVLLLVWCAAQDLRQANMLGYRPDGLSPCPSEPFFSIFLVITKMWGMIMRKVVNINISSLSAMLPIMYQYLQAEPP